MNEGKYLNEDLFQKTKKKIKKISLLIMICSILIGSALIATGFIKTNISKKHAEKVNQERYDTALKKSKERVATAKKRLEEITKEKEVLKQQYNTKSKECDSLNMRDSDWFTKVNECHRQAGEIDSKITNLETEEFNINNADYKEYYDLEKATDYRFLAIIGAIVIGFGLVVSLVVYLISKKREINAYNAQSTIPVAKETVNEMAPVAGNVAKEVTQGIKEGLEDNSR